MYTQCLSRLSARRASLSNAQLLLTSSNASPGHPRLSPDVRSLMAHEHYSTSQHPEAAAPVTRTATAHVDTNWYNKVIGARDGASSGQSLGSFRAMPPIASIGVAELAAAFAIAGLGPIHTPTIMEPPCAVFPMTVQSPTWATPLMVLDDALAKALSTPSTTTPETIDRAGAPAMPTARSAAPEAAALGVATSAPSPAAAAAADHDLVDTSVKPSSPAAAAVAATAAAAGEYYLPAALRPLVPASVADYWSGVRAATREGLLHATIYVSPKAWPRVAPTVEGMLGANGTGPAGQVRFALVPLGADYAARAARAAAAAGVYDTTDDDGTVDGDGLTVRFGLDVALAMAVAAAGPGDRGGSRGSRVLDTCPAMVVRGGYTGSTRVAGGSGEVSPAWSMRQDLDEHVRRNLQHGLQLQQVMLLRQQKQVLLQRKAAVEAAATEQEVEEQQQEKLLRLQRQLDERRQQVERLLAGMAVWGAWAGGRLSSNRSGQHTEEGMRLGLAGAGAAQL